MKENVYDVWKHVKELLFPQKQQQNTYIHTHTQQQQQEEKPLQHVLMISWSKLICLYSYIFSELIEIITAPNNVIETTWTQ